MGIKVNTTAGVFFARQNPNDVTGGMNYDVFNARGECIGSIANLSRSTARPQWGAMYHYDETQSTMHTAAWRAVGAIVRMYTKNPGVQVTEVSDIDDASIIVAPRQTVTLESGLQATVVVYTEPWVCAVCGAETEDETAMGLHMDQHDDVTGEAESTGPTPGSAIASERMADIVADVILDGFADRSEGDDGETPVMLDMVDFTDPADADAAGVTPGAYVRERDTYGQHVTYRFATVADANRYVDEITAGF